MVNLSKGVCLKYYKRKDVQEAIVAEARDREIGVCFGKNRFGKRPDVLHYPQDVIELVKRGATSFHCSEERWSNPLTLGPELKQNDLNDLRIGWDLILDIDCKELEYSKIAGKLIVDALQHHDIKSLSVKFSGNHGFHIAVPFESFPETVNGKETRLMFPDGPKRIAKYLQHMIKDPLARMLLANASLTTLAKNCGKSVTDLMKNGTFDPFAIVDIDTILISSRHLYRMAYSFNEKSGLVSIPIEPEQIMDFEKSSAEPENVIVKKSFIDVAADKNDARRLFMQAHDFTPVEEEKKNKTGTKGDFTASETMIPEEFFPPCIRRIDQPLEDGKKRALFILINFLQSCGWSPDDIEAHVYAWNDRQPDKLREVYVKGQLRYVKMNKRVKLPPNCNNQGYYQDLMLCRPDNFCKRIKNPANYAMFKHKIMQEMEKKKKKRGRPKKAKPKQVSEDQDPQVSQTDSSPQSPVPENTEE